MPRRPSSARSSAGFATRAGRYGFRAGCRRCAWRSARPPGCSRRNSAGRRRLPNLPSASVPARTRSSMASSPPPPTALFRSTLRREASPTGRRSWTCSAPRTKPWRASRTGKRSSRCSPAYPNANVGSCLLRFFAGMTQSQIAVEVGISQMHVSRLLARTLVRLREGLEAWALVDSGACTHTPPLRSQALAVTACSALRQPDIESSTRTTARAQPMSARSAMPTPVRSEVKILADAASRDHARRTRQCCARRRREHATSAPTQASPSRPAPSQNPPVAISYSDEQCKQLEEHRGAERPAFPRYQGSGNHHDQHAERVPGRRSPLGTRLDCSGPRSNGAAGSTRRNRGTQALARSPRRRRKAARLVGGGASDDTRTGYGRQIP